MPYLEDERILTEVLHWLMFPVLEISPGVIVCRGRFVDINVGQNRTGIPIADQERVMQTVEAAARSGQLRGLHFYDGHNTSSDEDARARVASQCYTAATATTLAAIDVATAAAGQGSSNLAEIITSGSTTFLFALAFDWAPVTDAGVSHRVSPGTIVFHDARYDSEVVGTGMRPAALVLSRVISHPTGENHSAAYSSGLRPSVLWPIWTQLFQWHEASRRAAVAAIQRRPTHPF